MELTQEQKRALCAQGFVKLPGVVPPETVGAALRAINHSLGNAGIPPADLPTLRARSFCPELQGQPAIADLVNKTPIRSLAESAIGAGKIRPVGGGQVALRFPIEGEPGEPGPHLDGMYTPTNGVPQGTIQNFTALVGVFLSDLPHPYAGNFTVWPGSHHLYERYFREHGPEALLQGMPPVDLPAPEQFLCRAGDAVLAHYLLAHGIAGNASPHIRYAIFFRLNHVEHDPRRNMVEMWSEWEGMR